MRYREMKLKNIKLFNEFKNFYHVIGNHDIWLAEYLSYKKCLKYFSNLGLS